MLIGTALLAVAAGAAAIRIDAARTAVWRDADQLWEHTLAQYPTSSLARNQVALRRLEAGDLAVAREQFEASVALAPDFPLTHNYLGVTYARSGDLDRAIAEFSTAVRLNPSYASARLNLGNAYEKAGRMDLALAAYESGVPDAPWAISLLERAATLLVRMGKADEAEARHRRILAIDPAHAGARSRLDKPSP
jgi:tetratricopeptide (TPR) repeat protein